MSGSNGPVRYPGAQPRAQSGAQSHTQSHLDNSQTRHPNAAAGRPDPYAGEGYHGQAPDNYSSHASRPPRSMHPGNPSAAETASGARHQGQPWTDTYQSQSYGQTDPAQQNSQYFNQFQQPAPQASLNTDPYRPATDAYGGGHQQANQSADPQWTNAYASHGATEAANPYRTDPYAASPPQAAPSGYDFGAHHAGAVDAPSAAVEDGAINWGQGAQQMTADPAFHGHDFNFAAQDPSVDPSQQPAAVDHGFETDEDEYEYEDEDEGSGRGRKFLVLAALAGAIVVGGGVAYGYQALFAPLPSDAPPVVRNANGPAKVKPSDPGGRKFAHTDSKIMGRLGGAAPAATDPATGARKVSTMKIGRDGTIIPPSAPSAAGPRMVTGMTLGDTATGPSPIPMVKPAPAAASTSNAPPVEIAKVAPVTRTEPAAAAALPVKVTPPKPSPKAKAAAKPTETAALPPAKKPAPAATGPRPTGAGYVPVLASVPASKSSRMDALKQFADMQQKFAGALTNRTPDVQEANLGAKGTYHRLIAGPPGSADSARSVCNKLKAEGYGDCWVLAY